MPTDPDTDGIYENLDTNPLFTMDDVILYFNQMDWIMNQYNEPTCAFDVNHNGRIDFADIVNLYTKAGG
jgi:PKD repeat protein